MKAGHKPPLPAQCLNIKRRKINPIRNKNQENTEEVETTEEEVTTSESAESLPPLLEAIKAQENIVRITEKESAQENEEKVLTDCIIDDITNLKIFDEEPFDIFVKRSMLLTRTNQMAFVCHCDTEDKSAERWELTPMMVKNVSLKECGREIFDSKIALIIEKKKEIKNYIVSGVLEDAGTSSGMVLKDGIRKVTLSRLESYINYCSLLNENIKKKVNTV